MDLESKKRMAIAHYNKLMNLDAKFDELKNKILSDAASIKLDSLASIDKQEELLVRAGAINDVQKVLIESAQVALEFTSTLVDIELEDINRKTKH